MALARKQMSYSEPKLDKILKKMAEKKVEEEPSFRDTILKKYHLAPSELDHFKPTVKDKIM